MRRLLFDRHLLSWRPYVALLAAQIIFWAGAIFGDSKSTYGFALIGGAALLFHLQFGEDVRSGFALFVDNFSRTTFYDRLVPAASLLISLIIVMMTTAAVAWQDFSLTLWFTTRAVCWLSALISTAVLVELVFLTVVPMVPALLIMYGILATSIFRRPDPRSAIRFWGLDMTVGSYDSMSRFMAISFVWTLAACLCAALVWAFRHRARGLPSAP